MQDNNKSADATMLQTISIGIAIGTIPFTFLRFLQKDYSLAVLNAFATFFMVAVFCYIYSTKRTRIARWSIALISVSVMTLTVHFKGPEQLIWIYPALVITFYLLPARVATRLCAVFISVVSFLIVHEVTAVKLLGFIVSSSATIIFSYAFSKRMRHQSLTLEKIAGTDALTGIPNRRELTNRMEIIQHKLDRSDKFEASLIIIDIDYFKQINDKYGHQVGDEVLTEFSQLVHTDLLRFSDKLYRLGGEEFAILLENSSEKDAFITAENIRSFIEERPFSSEGITITISAGTAQGKRGNTISDWLRSADIAMYQAKHSGRNQSFVYSQ